MGDFGAIFWKKAWAIVQGNFQKLTKIDGANFLKKEWVKIIMFVFLFNFLIFFVDNTNTTDGDNDDSVSSYIHTYMYIDCITYIHTYIEMYIDCITYIHTYIHVH